MLVKSLTRCTLALVAAGALSLSLPAAADDVIDTINEALEAYKNGDYADAASSLDYASQLVKQKKGESLAALLPEPLDGWTAEEAESQAAGAAMFGGGVTASREYRKGDGQVSVQIVTDSPMLQGMMMMFSNPMFAASDGGKMERIKRQKAIVKYNSSGHSGTIQIVVANRFLVTVEGSGVSRDELVAWAEAIDYKKLAALP